jgi:ribosomal protein S18 acetylase RimI-like enzyme
MPLSREELLEAIEENPEELFGLFANHWPTARFRRDEHMRRMCFGVPVPFFNGMAMAHLNVGNCDPLIDEAIAEMNGTGMPWSWQVAPSSTPFDLKERLFGRGMRLSSDMPIMVADLRNWNSQQSPKQFEVLPVNDLDTFELWVEIAQAAFGLPKMVFDVFRKAQCEIGFEQDCVLRNFVGTADGEAVCCGTIFYGHGIAGIYTIGTPTEHRGRGYGSAITEACMAVIQEKGHDTVFLQASKMGFPVYEKIGFQEICKISILVPPEP